MDNLVIAICVVIVLLYILFFFVLQGGLNLRKGKEKPNVRAVLQKLSFGSTRHPKGRQFLSSGKIPPTKKDVA